jgi:hypothetical protein
MRRFLSKLAVANETESLVPDIRGDARFDELARCHRLWQ